MITLSAREAFTVNFQESIFFALEAFNLEQKKKR